VKDKKKSWQVVLWQSQKQAGRVTLERCDKRGRGIFATVVSQSLQ